MQWPGNGVIIHTCRIVFVLHMKKENNTNISFHILFAGMDDHKSRKILSPSHSNCDTVWAYIHHQYYEVDFREFSFSEGIYPSDGRLA